MSVIVRKADEADAETFRLLNADVQSLHAAAMPVRFKPADASAFTADAARAIIAGPDNFVFIATMESEPVGYAYAQALHMRETAFTYAWDEIHLHHVSVRPDRRRQGVASALLGAVRRAAEERQIKLVTLSTWAFNQDAQAFFRRNGFAPALVRFWSEAER